MYLKLYHVAVLVFCVSFFSINADFPQLHRALPGANGKPGYRVLSTQAASDKTKSATNQDKQDDAFDKTSTVRKHHNTMDFESSRSEAAVYSIISAVLVGLSGIFPLLIIPLEAGPSLKSGAGSTLLKLLLSFAVGSLLGDVFLHLLPESWATVNTAADPHWAHTVLGLWVVCGVLSFMVLEKIFMESAEDDESAEEDEGEHTESAKTDGKVVDGHVSNGAAKEHTQTNGVLRARLKEKNGMSNGVMTNGHANGQLEENDNICLKKPDNHHKASDHIQISGYLNLFANCIDNFTHGLAVAGSYLISPKVGLCTTIAILLHEIPHEVGDFAILLRSGFDRWKAAKAQVLTASGGVLGALFALYSDSAESAGDKTLAILPFTAGGFLYIALVTVVPDLLKESCPKESLKQIVCIVAGVLSMLLVTIMFE